MGSKPTPERRAPSRRRWLLACLCSASIASALAAAPPAVHTVTIQAMQYAPANLEVREGDTVAWVNHDPFPHTATTEQKGFDSGEILPEKSWRYVAGKPGSYPYTCIYHRTMKGMLVVKPRK